MGNVGFRKGHVSHKQSEAVTQVRAPLHETVGRTSSLPLIKHLQGGHLNGAALDAFEGEPLPPDSPLWHMENDIISPHSASCAECEDINITNLFIDNLKRFVDGRPLRNVIRRELQHSSTAGRAACMALSSAFLQHCGFAASASLRQRPGRPN